MTVTIESTIVKLIEEKYTINDVVAYLVMTKECTTKTEARALVTGIITSKNLDMTKPKPMSVQLKEWYIAQGTKALDLSKKDIGKQVLALGMSGGSVKYYTDMYAAASEIAKNLLARSK